MKMVANETELRNALKERAPEITIVTSYADTVKKKYGLDLKANIWKIQKRISYWLKMRFKRFSAKRTDGILTNQ